MSRRPNTSTEEKNDEKAYRNDGFGMHGDIFTRSEERRVGKENEYAATATYIDLENIAADPVLSLIHI